MSPRKYTQPDDAASISARRWVAQTDTDADNVERALNMYFNHCALWGHRRGWWLPWCKECGVRC